MVFAAIFILFFLPCYAVDLKGLFFSHSPETPIPLLSGIQTEGLLIPHSDKFEEELIPFLSQPITFPFLEEIQQKVIQYYKENERPVVDVLIPAGQDITDGIVHFVILEGKLGKVEATGARWFSNQQMAKQMRVRSGDVIEWGAIESDLEWLNRNPFRKATLFFEPGARVGQTDAILRIEDRFPLKVYAGYDSRYISGFNWGNAFGLDHQLSGTFSTDAQHHWGAAVHYLAPLPWRHLFQLDGSYSQAQNDIETVFTKIEIAWQLGGRYWVPFEGQQIGVGLDFKQGNHLLEYAHRSVFQKAMQVFQLAFEYETEIGSATLGGTVVLNPHYTYGKVRFEEELFFAGKWCWKIHALLQQALGSLPDSEKLPLAVRGYEENGRESAMVVRNEIHGPPLKFLKKQILSLLAFADFAYHSSFLASCGPGLRYHFGETVSIRFDYAFQPHATKAHFSALLAF